MPQIEVARGNSRDLQFHVDVYVASRSHAGIFGESLGRNPFGGHEDAAGKRLVDVVLQDQFEIRPILREIGAVHHFGVEHVMVGAVAAPRETIIHDLYP